MSSASHPNPWAEDLPKPISGMGTYLATLPDYAISTRMAVRPIHHEQAAIGHNTGWIVSGGAIFGNDPAANGQPPEMAGSWMLIREVSKEAALERLGRDIYAVGGAWDMSKVTISVVAAPK